MSEYIGLQISVGAKELIQYINTVPERTQAEVERKIPSIKQGTKRTVKNYAPTNRFDLKRAGTYRDSFTINNYARSKWEIGYEVYAKPPHYRLSHLLEGRNDEHPSYAHILKQFRKGHGEPTRFGKVGMVRVGTTQQFEHLRYGKEYAEKKVTQLYEYALEKSTSKLERN